MLVRSWVIYGLSVAVKEGERVAASQALSGCDPLVKPFAKQRLAKELRRAEQVTDSDDVSHLARVASFSVRKLPYAADYDDVHGLEKEYTETFGVVPKPRSGPWVSAGSLAFCAVAAVAGTLAYFSLRAFEPAQTPVGKLFERDFTTLAVAAANGNATGVDEALAGFAQEPAFHCTGELERLADAALALREAPSAWDAYRGAEVALNKALSTANHPYYVDADSYPIRGVTSPILMSFYVQQSGAYSANGQRISVLRLWRLDHLNVVQSKLGYTRAASPHAIVLLDHLEHDLVTQILPAVPDGEIMSLTDEDTSLSDQEWVAEIQTKGGELIRKHFAQAPVALTEKARRLGALLAKRRALLQKWTRSLGLQSGVLTLPRRLIPEGDYSSALHLRVPTRELIEWDNLHGDLLTRSMLEDFEEVREAYARSVERHEVQHRLDYAEERITIPEMLAYRMGGIDTMGHDTDSHPYRAGMELSAYLSQIADDPSPRLALLAMSRICLNKYTIRSAHGYAAAVALEATGKHLGLSPKGTVGRVATRPELATLALKILDHPMPEVRKAARSAYEDLFGQKLAQVKREGFRENPGWRH